jgi:type I site-specific restriction endonuclease
VPCVKLIQGCAELWITSLCARSGGRWRSSPSPRLGRSSVPRAERKSRTRWPGLPTELEEEPEETKRFDLLMLNLELSMLRTEPAYVRLQNQVREIAELLEEKDAIPILRVQMDLIQDIQADDWGRMRRFRCSSRARRRERDRAPAACGCYERCQVLCEGPPFPARAPQDHVTIQKRRRNKPLTQSDLAELERMLIAISGTASRLRTAHHSCAFQDSVVVVDDCEVAALWFQRYPLFHR